MTQDELKHVEHIGFALYGFAPTAGPVEQIYQWAVDWFARLGCSPAKGNANIGGKSNVKYKLFRNLDRMVRAAEFDGVTYWCMVAVPDDLSHEQHGEYYGENMGVTYSIRPLTKCLVFHARASILEDRIGAFLDAARQACEMLRPQYGIGYRRQFLYGPELYGMGMCQTRCCAPDDENMEYWGTMTFHDAFTLLRSVYPWNFLTRTQLDIRVGATRLEQWIKSDATHGYLTRFTDTVTLWTVPDQSIRPVRDALWEAGVILDRKRHFESVMHEYHVDENEVAQSLKTGQPLVRRPRGPGISEEEMLRSVLGAFGGPESRVLKKEASGEVRELSNSELDEVKEPKKSKRRGPRSDSTG
jgi:hypothetical protein